MIEYSQTTINSIDDYDNLYQMIPAKLKINQFLKEQIEELKITIGNKCTGITVEYPYYDTEYLSSYYLYYIKKFKDLGKECCRIHFFSNNTYLGYVTVRPSVHYLCFSKSFLSPRLLINKKAYVMLSTYSAHIYGKKYEIKSFPWMNQQRDFSMCAHIAAWSIMKYFGNEHTGYRDITLGELVERIEEQANRKLPSTGLNLRQLAEIFKSFNLTPIIITKHGNDKEFFRQITAYVESGIPVLAASVNQSHAFSIIGHGCVNYDYIDDKTGIIDHSECIDELVTCDDKLLPYKFISKSNNQDVDSVVIPLYNRVHLEYSVLYKTVMTFLQNDNLSIEKDSVIRIYLTSANSFKEFVAEDTDINNVLKDIILTLQMPKLIWCVDISSKIEFKNNLVSSRIIVDSTSCAGDYSPWLLMHDDNYIRYYDDGWCELNEKISPYPIYRHNLEEV